MHAGLVTTLFSPRYRNHRNLLPSGEKKIVIRQLSNSEKIGG